MRAQEASARAPTQQRTLDAGSFIHRHLGSTPTQIQAMLKALNIADMPSLLRAIVPAAIRLNEDLGLGQPCSEEAMLAQLARTVKHNRTAINLIGLGYHDCQLPAVIQRCFLENPGWYTAYTPYQAEIAQGRLELLLGFQQLVLDLTGLDYANASLLDEATAAAEAMLLCRRVATRPTPKFFVDQACFPQTRDVLATRAAPLGLELVYGDPQKDYGPKAEDYFGLLVQTPNSLGEIIPIQDLARIAHSHDALMAVGSDPLALILLNPPGAEGADIVYGNSQRFGVPLGYGGPHAAFFAVKDAYKRSLPGRLIGVSRDSKGRRAFRMTLQTREQHIRRAKATSNICTAQVLLANLAFLYAAYHGRAGLTDIAQRVHRRARLLAVGLTQLGYAPLTPCFFDTLAVKADATVYRRALARGYNLRQIDSTHLGISLNEMTTRQDVEQLWAIFAGENGSVPNYDGLKDQLGPQYALPTKLLRKDKILTHPIFQSYQTETKMMRYLRRLQQKDIALDRAMIPLGSCTMKLNAAAEMMPVSWKKINGIHPFAPTEQTNGYRQLIDDLDTMLRKITGFAAISFQPNSGAQGEYAGLLTIRAYHQARGEAQRNICLIPSSAHGTNPASAIMAGMQVVTIQCDAKGNVDLDDIKAKADLHADRLAALMITYPSTHGVFESDIRQICAVVHDQGGQVYMDGANLNALVGIARPADLGADLCHINLHKTFCIPHGGGGPGMGPIGVAKHLAPFLPKHHATDRHGANCVSAAPYGSASILPISWAYITMMGEEGLRRATELALLNANYLLHRLRAHYPILYTNANGYCAHECILDIRPIKKNSGISAEDITKRLMDYGFHAPTVSFPVVGTLMIEPTESESKEELDRFCDAMISIRAEIKKVASGAWPLEDNPLVHAPHTLADLYADWPHCYTKNDAFAPLSYLQEDKYFCPVNRIDQVYGDRNVLCSFPTEHATHG